MYCKHVPEGVHCRSALLLTRPEKGHEDRLNRGAGVGTVSATRLSIDHRRSNRLLGRPVCRLDVTPFEEAENRVPVIRQMKGEPKAFIVKVGLVEKCVEAVLDAPLGDLESVLGSVDRAGKRIPKDFLDRGEIGGALARHFVQRPY